MKVPKRAQVDTAIRAVRQQVRSTLRAVNLHAAKLLTRGRYAEAEEMVRIGRAIDAFQARVEDLRREWRAVMASAKGNKEDREKTPLWRFYRPVASALLSLGGTATLVELERALPRFLEDQTPADTAVGSRGVPRWKSMLKKARRPMTRERFLEPAAGKKWQLSAEGERLAHSEAPAESAK